MDQNNDDYCQTSLNLAGPTKEIEFRHCPNLTIEQTEIQANILGLYAIANYQIKAKVELLIDKIKKGWGDFVDICPATTHMQNMSSPIEGFNPNQDQMMVKSVVEKTSQEAKMDL